MRVLFGPDFLLLLFLNIFISFKFGACIGRPTRVSKNRAYRARFYVLIEPRLLPCRNNSSLFGRTPHFCMARSFHEDRLFFFSGDSAQLQPGFLIKVSKVVLQSTCDKRTRISDTRGSVANVSHITVESVSFFCCCSA